MDTELSKKQQIGEQTNQDEEDEKKPNEKKKRIKKEKTASQASQASGTRNSKKNVAANSYNQIVAVKRNQQNMIANENFMKSIGSLQIPEQLRLFFMKELRQTVPIVREIQPQHKFLLFGEIPLDLDFFINKMKIRKLDSNGNIFDKFRSIQRNVRLKNRIEFDLDSQYSGLSDFQYIIEALRSMNNNVAFQFAQCLQDYQNSVRYILARNDYYKKYLAQQNVDVDLNERIKQSLDCASNILDSLDPDNEIFIYNIISKQFNGLVTLKKGFSKGLIKNLGVSDDEFIRSVQENKVFHSLVDQVNHASIIYSQTKMEENPYLRLRPHEVIKSIHPDIHHHHSHQFQSILRNLVKEAIKKQDVIEQFLQAPQDEMIDDDDQYDYIPNPLPTFQQYQKFIKNINLHPHRYKFPPHKQIELFQNITQVLTKKQQNKIDFQQNLQKITEGNQVSGQGIEGINQTLQNFENIRQYSNNSDTQQEFTSATLSENGIQGNHFQLNQQSIINNGKEQGNNMNRSMPMFNENLMRNFSGNGDNYNGQQQSSLNQSLILENFVNGYGDQGNSLNDDNLSINSKSQFPLFRSMSQHQFSNVSQGMINNLFSEYQNSMKRSVMGDQDHDNNFEEENSSSQFYGQQSFFRNFEENQSVIRQQSVQMHPENGNDPNSLAQSVYLGNPNQQSEQQSRQEVQRHNHFIQEEEESQSLSKSQSQSYTLYNQSQEPSSSSSQYHNHKHYHHSRHKKFRGDNSNSSSEQSGENAHKENKIKDFYEQLLQYIGNDEEEDGLFPFPHINSTFKEDIIREYEKIRSMLEDGKYMSAADFNQFIEDINKQPRIKKKQYLKHLMKIPDHVDYEMKEKRKKEEKEKRRKAEKLTKSPNSNTVQQMNQSPPLSSSPSPKSANSFEENGNGNSFQFLIPPQQQFPQQQQSQQQQQQSQQQQQPLPTPAFNNFSHPQQNQQGGMFNFFSTKESNPNNSINQNESDRMEFSAENQNRCPPRFNNHCPPPPPPFFDKDCQDCVNQQKNQAANQDPNNPERTHPRCHPPPHHHHNHHHHPPPPPLHHFFFPFKPHHFPHPRPPPPPHPQQLISLIREYFQSESITDQSELLLSIKNTLQEAISQGSFNKKVGDFLQQEDNMEKASEVINHIITDKDAFRNLNEGLPFGRHPHHHPHPHRHPHHHPHHNPHKRQDQVIKKIYELNKNLSLDDEIQINDYLEVFYIGKTKLWKNFSKDFILNNSFRDVEDEINTLKKNELLQKYYPTESNQMQNDLQVTHEELFKNRKQMNNNQQESHSQSMSPPSQSSPVQNNSISTSANKINKELLQKIINQFKMGPPHPFKILLLLKKALQKIVKHIPRQYLTQPFLKYSLKMIVYLIQGDIENFIQCRQRIPLEIVESLEKKVMKKFSQIPII